MGTGLREYGDCEKYKGTEPRICTKHRYFADLSHVGELRICSVSTVFAQCPLSSIPRRKYRNPERLVDLREIRVRRNDCWYCAGRVDIPGTLI
jgi:hypothetical protein